jgi:hypothetical protein
VSVTVLVTYVVADVLEFDVDVVTWFDVEVPVTVGVGLPAAAP